MKAIECEVLRGPTRDGNSVVYPLKRQPGSIHRRANRDALEFASHLLVTIQQSNHGWNRHQFPSVVIAGSTYAAKEHRHASLAVVHHPGLCAFGWGSNRHRAPAFSEVAFKV